MSQKGEFEDSEKSDLSEKLIPKKEIPHEQKQTCLSRLLGKEGVDPPRQLPKRTYSLEPDMATGWKPKKITTTVLHNVFPINCSSQVVDFLIKQLYKKKVKQYQIAYLGPRKLNSYLLHENKKYENPYPVQKKLDPHLTQRPYIPVNPVIQEKNLKFNSNFQCGNLDAAIFISASEYDLFMRVDTNTKGHTNWYYFTVQNGNFVGTVRFNICNFRREKSLYERGLKPYFYSKKNSDSWKQGGQNISYQKRPLRYSFLYDDQNYAKTLKTYITLTFSYHFDTPNDTVELAYFIPYSYSRLLKFLPTLKNYKNLPPLKSLSGLPIPILEITDQQVEDVSKKVVIVASRIHPGESNSSFVCEGFLQYVCSQQAKAKEFRKNFVLYVIPMINPDGVIAGNYRTSLFGKDLNRTYNQSRKFAFPQTFHLLELIKNLKYKYKQRLNLFIDLHGHSVKKNIFMYGPQFSIQNPNYYVAKELPRILSTLTPYFRFYSCIFKISSEKSSTARATLNRFLNIPYTYTMQSSNGFYYDSEAKKEFELTSKKLKKMGVALGQAILMFKQVQNNKQFAYVHSSSSNHNPRKILETDSQKPQQPSNSQQSLQQKLKTIQKDENQMNKKTITQRIKTQPQIPEDQILSDDNISEGNSDSEPADEDLSEGQLEKLLQTIQQGRDVSDNSPQKSVLFNQSYLSTMMRQNQAVLKLTKLSTRNGKQKSRYSKKKNPLLPPINCLNRAMAKQKVNKTILEPKVETIVASPQKQRKSKHLSISQMIEDARGNVMFKKEEIFPVFQSIIKKKTSKLQLQKVKLVMNSPYHNMTRH